MGRGEPGLVQKDEVEHLPSVTAAPRHPVLADDIVIACTAGMGIMVLGGAGLLLTHRLYLTAHLSPYIDLGLFLLTVGTGTIAGFRARAGGLARRLFAICTGSALIPMFAHLGFGALVGWELALGAAALGGTGLWISRRKRIIEEISRGDLEPGPKNIPELPAPSNPRLQRPGTAP